MDTSTKTIAAIIIFAALALVISPIRIPTLFWPAQYYRIWEIPLIVLFFLFGFKAAFSASALFSVGYIALFPGPSGIFGFPWMIALMLVVLLGLSLANYIIRKFFQKGDSWKKQALYFTVFGTLSRTLIMPLVDYVMYRFFLPFATGQIFTDAFIFGLMPGIIFFNITVPIYTIPISYFAAKTVSRSLKIGNLY